MRTSAVFKATTEPSTDHTHTHTNTHTDRHITKARQGTVCLPDCVSVCVCVYVWQHLHENDEWFYGLLDLNFIVCMHAPPAPSYCLFFSLPFPPAATPCLTLSPVSIASGKFYVCIRNWIFALVMEMRKLQLDLFFTGLSWLGLSRFGLLRSRFGLPWLGLLVGVRAKWQHAQHSAQLHLHCWRRSISAAGAAAASASVFFVAVYGFLVMILPAAAPPCFSPFLSLLFPLPPLSGCA